MKFYGNTCFMKGGEKGMKRVSGIIAAVVLLLGSPSMAFAKEHEISDEASAESDTLEVTVVNEVDGGLAVNSFADEFAESLPADSQSVLESAQDTPVSDVELSDDLGAQAEEHIDNAANIAVGNLNDEVPADAVAVEKEYLSAESQEKANIEADVLAAAAAGQNEEESVVKEKRKPLLSINLLGITINLLAEDAVLHLTTKNESGKTGVLSLGVADLLELGLLSGQTSPEENKASVLSVGLKTNLLGNATIDLISKKQQGQQTAGNLLGIGLEDSLLLKPITGDLRVGLVSSVTTQLENSVLTQTDLLSLGIQDSALLGNLDVGVVSGTSEVNEEGSIETLALAKVKVDSDLLGKADVGVLQTKTETNGDTTKTQSGIVLVDVPFDDGKNIHLGIGEVVKEQSPNLTKTETYLIHSKDRNNQLALGTTKTKNQPPAGQNGNGGNDGQSNNGNNDSSDKGSNNPNPGNNGSNDDSKGNNPTTGDNPESNFDEGTNNPDEMNPSKSKDGSSTDVAKIEKNDNTVGKLLNELLDNGKKMIVNGANSLLQAVERSKEVQKQVRENVKYLPTQKDIAPTNSQSNSNSSSASASNVSDGQSQVVGYISQDLLRASAEKAKLKAIEMSLADQWLKPPLDKPPIQISFFSAN